MAGPVLQIPGTIISANFISRERKSLLIAVVGCNRDSAPPRPPDRTF